MIARTNNRALGAIGAEVGLDQCVVKARCQVGDISNAQLATTVEAMIGAAYLDAGMQAAEDVIKTLGILDYCKSLKHDTAWNA